MRSLPILSILIIALVVVTTAGFTQITVTEYTAGGWTDDGTVVRLTTSTDLVGIGTENTYKPLTMNGTIGFEDGTTPLLMNSENCCTYGSRMIWAHSPDFPYWGIFYDDNDDQMRWQGSENILTIDFLSGHVGINTASPSSQLDVKAEGGYSAIYGNREDNGNLGIIAYNSTGVYGYSPNDYQYGVTGVTSGSNSYGVNGETTGSGGGVRGENSSSGNYGLIGSLYYGGYFYGDVHVNGNLSASGTKPFVQPHRKDPSKEIVYISAEAPEAVVLLRGTAQLEGGNAIIEIPEHFRLVAAEEGVQVQVTPAEDCNGLFVANKSRERIEIKELMGGKHNAKFDYLVTAVRAGFEEHQVITENRRFKPGEHETAQEFEKRFSRDDMSTRATRATLISNGILTEDGKLNMVKVEELGWTVARESSTAERDQMAKLRKQ